MSHKQTFTNPETGEEIKSTLWARMAFGSYLGGLCGGAIGWYFGVQYGLAAGIVSGVLGTLLYGRVGRWVWQIIGVILGVVGGRFGQMIGLLIHPVAPVPAVFRLLMGLFLLMGGILGGVWVATIGEGIHDRVAVEDRD